MKVRKSVACIIMAVSALLCSWLAITFIRPMRVAYTSWQLKELREKSTVPREGTDEHMRALLHDEALKVAMNLEGVVALLGSPDRIISNRVEGVDLIWIMCDYGSQREQYVVRFDLEGNAVFVPFLKNSYYKDGMRVVEFSQQPDDF